MKFYDISMSIEHDMPVYKNTQEKRPFLEVTRDYSCSDGLQSTIHMDLHTGTHVDAPLHNLQNGDTVDNMDLNKVITKCRVIDLSHVCDGIIADDLKGKEIKAGDFIIFKTKNSNDNNFNSNFIYLKKSGAEFLKEVGIKGVGIDSLGIERSQDDHITHKTLAEKEIVILEGLRLKEIEEGEYTLVALPLKIKGAEASPVRAVLFPCIAK